ncbi:MAG: hypothetical protein NTY96_11620 [Bacteroidetes bacterium]|nr:hypothetical protein [Bacteroidota bacterium]
MSVLIYVAAGLTFIKDEILIVKRVGYIWFFLLLFLPLLMKGQLQLHSGPAGSCSDQEYSVITGKVEAGYNPGTSDCTFIPVIIGPATACEGSTANVYQTDPGGSGYTWTISAGGNITGGSSTNTITVTWNTAGPQSITVDFTDFNGCTASTPKVYPVTVNPNLPVSISISASANPACEGDLVVFTATPVNGGSSPSYQWKVNSISVGTNSSTYTYTPTNNDQVICILTSNEPCKTGDPATSNQITMIVNPGQPVSVSIAASANPVCQGVSVTFTATPVNGGSSPSYQWKVNGSIAGTNNPVFSYTPFNTDIVTCVLTSNVSCATGSPATSNQVIMSVSPILSVSVSITANPAGSVCEGTMVTYTAVPVNGGSAPFYQWKVNGSNAGANSATYSFSPVNGDVVSCVMTSNTPCESGNPATSNAITMTVTPNLPVSISIAASANPVCQSTPVIFTATPVNGGSSPAYQWIVNGFSVGTNSPVYTYAPSNNDVILCYLLSSVTCTSNNPAISNTITMTVNPVLPVSVSIGVSANPICQGTAVTFTATPTNGGSSPAYQWKVNGTNSGANNATYSYIPANGDVVSCVLTSNVICPSGNPAASNPITMTVSPNLPVSVTISASSNPVCQGGPVTFTATPVNGGSFPIYQWKVNGVVVGGFGSIYTYIPVNGDAVTCRLTSNINCATGNPAISNTITMIVSPGLPVSVSIAASANPFCQGQAVIFTATPTNEGLSPAYQWYVNGIGVGISSPTYAYVPSNNDNVTCILTSSFSCATGNPATSNQIVMIADPVLPVTVSISASSNPSCPGQSVTYTATPVNGGSSPSYQWKVNGLNAGTDSPAFIYTPANGDVIRCVLTSNAACVSGNPANSNQIIAIVSAFLPVSITISASTNFICMGTPVTFTATPVNGGSSPAYQWFVNGIAAGTNSPTFTYTPASGDVVTCQLTSSLSCASGNPALSNSITMAVYSYGTVSVVITPSANPACQGSPVTFTATPNNGGSSPAYQWKVNGVNVGTNSNTYTYTPANGDVIICVLTSNYLCPLGNPATSNTITMTVLPNLAVGVTITASANPVCPGTLVTFTATPTNGGSNPSYQWFVNGLSVGTNSNTYTYTPVNGDVITCQLTSNTTCPITNPVISNSIVMTVLPNLPVSVIITASANPVCSGIPVTFTATPTNGGSGPVYQWKVNGVNVGTNSNTYTYTPVNGDVITCILTSNATCATGSPATSNTIVMVVNPNLPVSVFITASANPACLGTSVTFTATPTNGGSSPSYQWKVNGVNAGTNSSTYTYTPANGDVIICIMTSNYSCPTGNPATSNTITMTVLPNLAAGVTITASANPVCQAIPVTFTATPTNGGASPSYQWKVNGINVGTNSPIYTYTPANGDAITCTMISNATCATGNPAVSNTIVMVVNSNLPVSVIITASANPICAAIPVTFTATPTNGGSSPVYQWKVNGINVGTNSSTYTYTPVNFDIIRCVLTSNATCATGSPATSNAIIMVVNPNLPVSVIITASANPICQGTAVTFTAAPANGGTSPSYQWKVNGINAGTNSPTFTYTPANGDVITCVLTSNATCPTGNPATSNSITMTVTSSQPVSVLITASANPVCQPTSVTFTATPTNGGSSPIYKWMVNGSGVGINSPTYSYTPANGDIITCILTSNALCATGNPAISNAIIMTVAPYRAAGVSISASANPVCQGTQVTYTATPVNGGTSPSYQWKVNGVNSGTNSPSFTYTPSNGDVIFCVMTSNYLCLFANPVNSNVIPMTVNPNLPAGITITASANPICAAIPVIFTASLANGGTSPTYLWKVNGTSVGTNTSTYTYTPANGDIIQCILTSNAVCATGNPATSNSITMTVNPNLPVSVSIAASANPVCIGTSVTFTANPVNGGISPVYQWYKNGVIVIGAVLNTYTPVSIADGDQFYCILTSNAICATGNPATSSVITMTVDAFLPVSITILVSPGSLVCANNPLTFTAVPVNGGASPSFQWTNNGTPVSGATSSTYSPASLVNGDVIRCILTSSLLCNTGNPATSNAITMMILPIPVVTFALCNSVTTHDAPAFILSQGIPLGGVYSGTGVVGNTFNPSLVPPAQNTVTITYTYTNAALCSVSAIQVITLYPPAGSFVCGQTLTDVRDNQTYTTQLIGSQCWLSQNLNYGTFISFSSYQTNNCLAEKYCYSDVAGNCATNGGLYQWDELMQYQTTQGIQGLCPPGWHIPSQVEWSLVETTLNGPGNAGDSLKAGGFSGFNALLSGVLYSKTTWKFTNFATFFWTSTPYSTDKATSHGLNVKDKSVSDYQSGRHNAFSVRCLKN